MLMHNFASLLMTTAITFPMLLLLQAFFSAEGRELYFQQYGEYKNHKIWRDDALPCRVYLRHWSVVFFYWQMLVISN